VHRNLERNYEWLARSNKGRGVRESEKGHNFDRETGTCTRCGMTVREYEDHGRPPCRGNTGERPREPSRAAEP
jgi:hypothetical protein